MSKREFTLPTFIVIGPGRAGTTWIYEVLRAHPDVCMAKDTKETLFFEREFGKGIDWYAGFFKDCHNAQAIGEVSNTYIYNGNVPQRIHEVVPEATLIACLRDPIERIQSAYRFRKRNGAINVDFDDAIEEQPDLVTDNHYWTQLQRFLAYFPELQVRILFYDDLCADPAGFAAQLYRAVGVDDGFVPDAVSERVNVSASPRIPGTGRLFKGFARALRSMGHHRLLTATKRNRVVQSLLYRPAAGSSDVSMSKETYRRLLASFRAEIEGVEAFTGRDLSHWKR